MNIPSQHLIELLFVARIQMLYLLILVGGYGERSMCVAMSIEQLALVEPLVRSLGDGLQEG